MSKTWIDKTAAEVIEEKLRLYFELMEAELQSLANCKYPKDGLRLASAKIRSAAETLNMCESRIWAFQQVLHSIDRMDIYNKAAARFGYSEAKDET